MLEMNGHPFGDFQRSQNRLGQGGVRMDGKCEVKPEMRCVWVEAWRGAQKMSQGGNIKEIQQPVNYSFKGSSSWLRVVQDDVKNKLEMPADVRIKR